MNRLFCYFSVLCIGLGFTSCKDKKTDSIDVETSVPIDQNKMESSIDEFKMISQEKVNQLNEAINSKKIVLVEDIMKLYAPEDKEAEGNYTYDITVLAMSNSALTLVTLVEDGLNDDSVKARKIVMSIKGNEGAYRVTQIKESYQCWEGRGHVNWSAAACK